MRASALVAALLLSAIAVGVATAQPDRMTICHKADGQARTIEVARSAWKAHQGHGDTEGACKAASSTARPPSPPPPPPPPATDLALSMKADGDLDGDAVFRLDVGHGSERALGVVVSGKLAGEGRWRFDAPGADCRLGKGTFECHLPDLASDEGYRLTLLLDGPLVNVCREAAVDAALRASNDSTSGDDSAKESVWVGACSPLDH